MLLCHARDRGRGAGISPAWLYTHRQQTSTKGPTPYFGDVSLRLLASGPEPARARRNRLQRGRTHVLVPPLDGGHLGPADEQAAGRHYLAPGDELLAVGGRQEVHFVLDREHLAVGWRERHRCVPAGGVRYGARDGTVEVALLLGDPLGERHLDDAGALAYLDDFRSKQPHQALAGEARPHPLTGVVPAGRLLGRLARVLAHPSPFWWFA